MGIARHKNFFPSRSVLFLVYTKHFSIRTPHSKLLYWTSWELGLGIHPNKRYGRDMFTLFEYCIAYDVHSTLPLLVSAGGDVNGSDGYPLRLSVFSSDCEMTATLLAAGADLELALRHSSPIQKQALLSARVKHNLIKG